MIFDDLTTEKVRIFLVDVLRLDGVIKRISLLLSQRNQESLWLDYRGGGLSNVAFDCLLDQEVVKVYKQL